MECTYDWNADLVRDDLRSYVVGHLGDPGGVLVVDETGFLKKGVKSVGVKRQYSGTAGRIENCQIGVFLSYASQGASFLDRELYLPKELSEDAVRRAEAGVPEDVEFMTKPQLAKMMLSRAMEAGVPASWVTGDEVYGPDASGRLWLVQEQKYHMLAIKSTEPLWTDPGFAQLGAATLAT